MPLFACLCCLCGKKKDRQGDEESQYDDNSNFDYNELEDVANTDTVVIPRDITELNASDLTRGGAIGGGGTATAYLATLTLQGEEVQVVEKVIGYEVAAGNAGSSDFDFNNIAQSELAILRAIQADGGHENLNVCYGYTLTAPTAALALPRYSLVLGYANQSNLFTFFPNTGHRILEEHMLTMTTQIVNGLAYLHQHRIVHRDLKMENIFLNIHNNVWRIIIGDFGSAVITQDTPPADARFFATPGYAAPELFTVPSAAPMDVFSLAVVLWSMATLGEYDLFSNEEIQSHLGLTANQRVEQDKDDVLQRPDHRMVVAGRRPNMSRIKDSSPLFRYSELIEQMWSKHPNRRPTIENIAQTFSPS